MADGEDTQTEETAQDPFEQFFASISGGGVDSTFSENFQYSRRAVRGISQNLTPEQQAAITGQLKRIGVPGVADDRRYYEGEFLVDPNGVIVRAPYDAKREVYDVLYQMPATTRAAYSDLLASRGFYGSSKPSAAGTLSKDRTAWAEFLNAANAEGITWEAFAQKLSTQAPVRSVGGGSRYRVSSREDVEAYLRQASLERLGRTMTKQDVDVAIKAIQGQQAQRAASGQDVPSLEVAAEKQVSKMQPERERSFKYAQAIDLAMDVLGSGQ